MRSFLLSILGVFGVVALLSSSANAGKEKFRNVPGTKGKALKMRTVAYNGSTNGRMVIEVRNDGKKTQSFEAAGLYFVPGGDPDSAPQRLGAAGPFEIVSAEGATGDAVQKTSIKPGETVKLELHVFCIDSHRSSPSSETPFAVAGKRMPKKLRAEIQFESTKIVEKHKGKVAPEAADEIQSHVWKTRNKKWIKLEGERAHEKDDGGDNAPRQQQRRYKHH